MVDLLELVVGESTEFKLLLENIPAKIRSAMNSGIQAYVSPSSAFFLPFGRESSISLFKFFRAHKNLNLKPLVFKLAFQSEEFAKAYGAMLGFAITRLVNENVSRDELYSFIRLCEKALLLRSSSQYINLLANTFLVLRRLSVKGPISISEVHKLEEALYNSTSIEQISAVIKEVAKINNLVAPRVKITFDKWHSSQLLA